MDKFLVTYNHQLRSFGHILVRLLMIASILLFSLPANPAYATDITADITQDTTWTKANNPYNILQSITIFPGATLTIQPGVSLVFSANAGMTVKGKLLAQGSDNDPIQVGGPGLPSPWVGIHFLGSLNNPLTGSQLQWVNFTHGGANSSVDGILYLEYASVDVSHSTFQSGSSHGIFGRTEGYANIADTSFINNGGYAVFFEDGSVNPSLRNLSATGNLHDGVGLGGYHDLTGQRTWQKTGIPYMVGNLGIPNGSSLTIEPGVEVQFDHFASLNVAGRLQALGIPGQPITFTGMIKSPGWWSAMNIEGNINAPALAMFDYVTLEYGGASSANLYVADGQVSFQHGVIRNSGRAGIQANGDTHISIQTSQVISNTNEGILNASIADSDIIYAPNNWWGSTSGPTVSSDCNPGGTGSLISAGNVIFQPYLSTSNQSIPLGPIPSQAMLLTIDPHRWFAPSDGNTRVWVTLKLTDGNGAPVPGRLVGITANFASVSQSVHTDLQGEAQAYLTSATAGDIQVIPRLEDKGLCEFIRSAPAKVTFNAEPDTGLFQDVASPYFTDDLQITPMPVMVGVPTQISAQVSNPNSVPITVNVTFSFESAHIGMNFLPVGELNGVIIPANATKTIFVDWTPTVSGHICFQVSVTITAPAGMTSLKTPQFYYQNISADGSSSELLKAPNSGPANDYRRRNIKSMPGPLMGASPKNAAQKAQKSLDIIDVGSTILGVVSDAAGQVTGFFQGLMVGNILSFNLESAGAINCAMGGGSSCGGWSGPQMSYPGQGVGSIMKDPPRQDYKVLAIIHPIPFTLAQASPTMPAARAAALNNLTEASLDLVNKLAAFGVSSDRYAGAVEAGDMEWESLQASAAFYYSDASAAAMTTVADALDALIQEAKSEGYSDIVVTAEDYQGYKNRLQTQGFSENEIDAAHLVGFDDASIEIIRQKALATNANQAAGGVFHKWSEVANNLRTLGMLMLHPPFYIGYGTLVSAGSAPIQNLAAADNRLVELGETVTSFQVSNPITQTATVDLSIRRLNLPPDWMVVVTPSSISLAPGQVITATVTISPGAPVPQGNLARLAVEGYIGTLLIGGIILDVSAPYYRPFDGKLSIFLPMIIRH